MSFLGRIEHLRLRRFLDAAIDGELRDDLDRRVRDHITQCPVCSNDEQLTHLVKARLPIVPRSRPAVGPHDRPGS